MGPLPGGLSFGQAGGQIRMTGSAGAGQEGFAGLLWNTPLLLAESWQIEVAYNSGSISLGSGNSFVGAGIFLLNELDETGLQVGFEYSRDPNGQLELQVGAQETSFAGASQSGTLRLSWNAENQTLTASSRNSGEVAFDVASVLSDPFDAGLTEVNLLLGISVENASLVNPLALDDFSVSTLKNP